MFLGGYTLDVVTSPANWHAIRRGGALGYYHRMGFVEQSWDPADLVGIASDRIQMIKILP